MALFIHKRKIGKNKRTYYYLVEAKRVNGKPKFVWQKYLGSAEKIHKLLEQREVFEPIEADHLGFGDVSALFAQAQELKIKEIVDEVVSQGANRKISVGTYLVVGTINRAINPTSKDSVGRWMKRTIFPRLVGQKAEEFDSQSFWDAMDLITDEHIQEIEEKTRLRTFELYDIFNTDQLIYDPTNFATYIDSLTKCTIAQRGKPKKGSKGQRLIGLAMASTLKYGIPLMHRVYEGNIHDAKLFPEAISLTVKRYHELSKNCEHLTIIFDKGNNSLKNISFANAKGVYCVGSLKSSNFPKFLSIPLKNYHEEIEGLKVYRTTHKVFGANRVIIVTYNHDLFKRQYESFHHRLKKIEDKLKKGFSKEEQKQKYRHKNEVLQTHYEKLLRKKKASKYLRVKVKGEKRRKLVIEPNKREIKKKERRFGKLIIFSDRFDWSSPEIVSAYHGKNIQEENFKFLNTRHYLNFAPVYHWTDQKIKAHALMCVLGLLLIRLLLYRAAKSGLKISLERMMWELEDIEELVLIYPNHKVLKKTSRLSDTQKRLFDIFTLSAYQDTVRQTCLY